MYAIAIIYNLLRALAFNVIIPLYAILEMLNIG